MGEGVPWTSIEEETAIKLADEGFTARQIMGSLPGRSRNSIIGFLTRRRTRLGLAPRRVLRPRGSLPKERSVAKRKTPFVHRKYPVVMNRRLKSELLPLNGGVEFLNLKWHHCRWPYEDEVPYVFCGRHKTKGSSYCADHQWISIRKPFTNAE